MGLKPGGILKKTVGHDNVCTTSIRCELRCITIRMHALGSPVNRIDGWWPKILVLTWGINAEGYSKAWYLGFVLHLKELEMR